MTKQDSGLPQTIEAFMARACALETEAAERYAELAEVMHDHNNPEVARLFDKLARIERMHRDHILASMGWRKPPRPHAFRWETPEGPETADFADLHYLMTPWHALKLAEHNERRAAEFFEDLAGRPELSEDLREDAAKSAAEEREHVRLIQEWLARVNEPGPGWDEDLDPPNVAD
jgi:rubrerythrin